MGRGPQTSKVGEESPRDQVERGRGLEVEVAFSSYDGDLSLPLGLALGSPIFPSGCEGKLGVALEDISTLAFTAAAAAAKSLQSCLTLCDLHPTASHSAALDD